MTSVMPNKHLIVSFNCEPTSKSNCYLQPQSTLSIYSPHSTIFKGNLYSAFFTKSTLILHKRIPLFWNPKQISTHMFCFFAYFAPCRIMTERSCQIDNSNLANAQRGPVSQPELVTSAFLTVFASPTRAAFLQLIKILAYGLSTTGLPLPMHHRKLRSVISPGRSGSRERMSQSRSRRGENNRGEEAPFVTLITPFRGEPSFASAKRFPVFKSTPASPIDSSQFVKITNTLFYFEFADSLRDWSYLFLWKL